MKQKAFLLLFIFIIIGCNSNKTSPIKKVNIANFDQDSLVGMWFVSGGLFPVFNFENDSIVEIHYDIRKKEKYTYSVQDKYFILVDFLSTKIKLQVSYFNNDSMVLIDITKKDEMINLIKSEPPFMEYKNKDGKLDAKIDIKNGKYKFKTYGLHSEWFDLYCKILLTKYNIEVEGIAGCVVTNDIRKYVEDYNSVSMAEIKKKYGNDIFEKSKDEAIEGINKQANLNDKPL